MHKNFLQHIVKLYGPNAKKINARDQIIISIWATGIQMHNLYAKP